MAHLIPFIKQLTLSSFSRHGIAQASLALLIWLNENVRLIAPSTPGVKTGILIFAQARHHGVYIGRKFPQVS